MKKTRKTTDRYRSKLTGKFVSKAAWKRWPGKIVRQRYDVRRKKTKLMDQLGLETKKQQKAFLKTTEKFLKNDRFRAKILKRIEDTDLGLRPGSGKETSYANLKKRFTELFDTFGDGSGLPEFGTITENFRRMQNTKRTTKFKRLFPIKKD